MTITNDGLWILPEISLPVQSFLLPNFQRTAIFVT